jgi:hypothetical protein
VYTACTEKKVHNDDVKRERLLEDLRPCPIPQYDPTPYVFDGDEHQDSDEENKEDEEGEKTPEYTYRHPGSVLKGGDDEELWANVFTRASKRIFAIDLVGPDIQCSLRPIYRYQIAVRVDENDNCIYYDCLDYVPTAIDLEEELPKNRWVQAFDDILTPRQYTRNGGYMSDSDSEIDDDAPELDQPVTLGGEDTPEIRRKINLRAIFGEFANSKCFRVKLPLELICGMALKYTKANNEEDDSRCAVLVLELIKPVDDFAVRCIGSSFANANKFRTCEQDWTPNQAGSGATRHYIYGMASELQNLAAHLCHLSPQLTSMMATESSKKRKTSEESALKVFNTLTGASLSYDDAPTVQVNNVTEESIEEENLPSQKLTPDMVDKLFLQHGLVGCDNLCLKAAVLKGHQVIRDETNRETVLFEGECHGCDNVITMTWGQAMVQQTYAGLDYEDGGEDAEVRCEDCGGNYLTGLCEGKPHFDCGKFHNHCTECPDFGVCIHDYRNAHCYQVRPGNGLMPLCRNVC